MLDDGMGFSLLPWKPVIEQRLGQQIATTVRGGGAFFWETARRQGQSFYNIPKLIGAWGRRRRDINLTRKESKK